MPRFRLGWQSGPPRRRRGEGCCQGDAGASRFATRAGFFSPGGFITYGTGLGTDLIGGAPGLVTGAVGLGTGLATTAVGAGTGLVGAGVGYLPR